MDGSDKDSSEIKDQSPAEIKEASPEDTEKIEAEEAEETEVTASGSFISAALSSGHSHSSVESLIGKVVDKKYKVLETLGEGGMGTVYKAEHLLMNRVIALKMLHPSLMESKESLKRFLHEARVASKLSHPNAVTLYDFGVEEGMPYIAMEFLKGSTLKEIIEREGAQPLPRVFSILEQVGGALSEAHTLGIIHRDLKPENIMVSTRSDGTEWVRVLDFGIAKMVGQTGEQLSTVMTRTGMFYGTPQYMSPEAVSGQLDARSDIYSLGIILYEMISGDAPFKAPSMMQVLMKHLNEKPRPLKKFQPPLKVPKAVDVVVMKALEKPAENRYQSVTELIDEFRQALGVAPAVSGAHLAAITKEVPPPERPKMRLLPVIFVVLLLLAGGAFALFQSGTSSAVKDSVEETLAAGTIRIISKPRGAEIALNDRVLGKTNAELKNVSAGTYQIKLRKEGYTELLKSVTVKPGETSLLQVDLVAQSKE